MARLILCFPTLGVLMECSWREKPDWFCYTLRRCNFSLG